jgi:multidrug efflux pump subunit AcrA (membrane-fusion protein)
MAVKRSMNRTIHSFSAWRQCGIHCVSLGVLLCLAPISGSQTLYPSASGDMLMYQSAGASQVVEKVRAGAPGVMFEIFVKPGDTVAKGQILGYTDLESTKLQLDVAKAVLESKANVEAAQGQAEAWSVTRQETEDSFRRRKLEKTRLEWATAMEKMYRGTYEVQMDAEKIQLIQYEYWKDQYEKRFFRAPVEGVVSEVLADVGKQVAIAAHVFTIRNDQVFSIPVTIPSEVARTAESGGSVPVRPANSKASTRALVDSVSNNPAKAGDKIIRLLVPVADFPAAMRTKLIGMKFEVLFPLASTR